MLLPDHVVKQLDILDREGLVGSSNVQVESAQTNGHVLVEEQREQHINREEALVDQSSQGFIVSVDPLLVSPLQQTLNGLSALYKRGLPAHKGQREIPTSVLEPYKEGTQNPKRYREIEGRTRRS